jgi:hypothetical protein
MNAPHSDDLLRARFRALADQEAADAPAFSRERIEAHRALARARRVWRTTSATIVVGVAAAVMLIAWPRTPPLEFDLSGVSWYTPTDFLLDTPGSELLRSIPAIGPGVYELPPAAQKRGDTSERTRQ